MATNDKSENEGSENGSPENAGKGYLSQIWAGIMSLFSGREEEGGDLGKIIRSSITFLVLLFYFILFVFNSVLTLSSHQLQFSMRGITADGVSLSLAKVADIQNRIDSIERNIAHEDNLLGEAFSKIESGKHDDDLAPIKAEIQNIFNRIELLNQNRDDALVINDTPVPELLDFIYARKFLNKIEGWQISELQPFGIRLGVPHYSQMPPGLLTLLLVLFMGALGGTIHLTKQFLDRFSVQNSEKLGMVRSGSYYIFRPILGAVTGLVVYVLAKAGVLVVALPSNSGNAAQLSPFFVSFLGIISGMLAEEALDTIRKTGSAWFKTSKVLNVERWATDLLAEEIFDSGDKTNLANHLEMSNEDLTKWLEGKERIPTDKQIVISAWLRKPIRNLFTDLEPGS